MNLLIEIFFTFAKLGAIAYGGGAAMIPVIQAEVVEAKNWVKDDDFRTALAIGNTLPGPIAPQMAFWTGLRVAGFPGAVLALIAVQLPGVTAMFLISSFFWSRMGENVYLSGAARGASVGVVGLLGYVAYDQAFKVFARGVGWRQGLAAHPNWVVLVLVVFALSVWRPTWMVPLSLIGSAVYGAFFLR